MLCMKTKLLIGEKSLINRDVELNEVNAIKKLTQLLGYLPLSLAQAGAYIQNKAIKVTNYLNLYQQYEQKMLCIEQEHA